MDFYLQEVAYGTSKIIYYTLFQGLYWFSPAYLACFLLYPLDSGGVYQSLNHAESFTSFWNSVDFDGLAVQESQSLCFWTDLLSFSLD